jgi:uncharacterized membrane protein YbjE (DUF340 family)
MVSILVVLTLGIMTGWLIIRKPAIHQINNHLLNGAIYLLLLLLGISVGINKEVIGNLGKIGVEAICIAIASISGSVFFCTLLFRMLFKGK